MSRIMISSFAVMLYCLIGGVAQAQYWIAPPPPPPVYVRHVVQLEPGDVIMSINNRQLFDLEGFVEALDQSGPVMHFTVRDGRTGRHLSLATRLRAGGHRFGVLAVENGGNGVMIRQVFFNSAAQNCWHCNGATAGNNAPPVVDRWDGPDGTMMVAAAKYMPASEETQSSETPAVESRPVRSSSVQIRRHQTPPPL